MDAEHIDKSTYCLPTPMFRFSSDMGVVDLNKEANGECSNHADVSHLLE